MSRRQNKVRIISGRLRGRFVTFIDQNGLRPTGDRLRETLFSWLQPSLPGSRCFDMFAGSGVLGFESISRGAAAVTLMERSARVVAALNENARNLDLSNIEIICGDALRIDTITRHCAAQSMDIVFVDPPFVDNTQQAAIELLHQSGVLAAGALVAVENSKRQPPLLPPQGWQQQREKVAGEVRLTLFCAPGRLQNG